MNQFVHNEAFSGVQVMPLMCEHHTVPAFGDSISLLNGIFISE
jgi:hypothetical protein